MKRAIGASIDITEDKTAEEIFIEAFRSNAKRNVGWDGPLSKEAADLPENSWNETSTPPSWYASKIIGKYDQEWFEWEPETLWITIQKDFKTILGELARNKINATKTVLMNDSFWEEWEVFEKIVVAFNDNIPNFLMVEVPSPAQMAWAVREANYLNPGNYFSDEVSSYVRAACKEVGLVYFPDDLQFAQSKPLGRLASDVRAGWEMIQDNLKLDIVENDLGVNLVRLQAIAIYAQGRTDARS